MKEYTVSLHVRAKLGSDQKREYGKGIFQKLVKITF